MDFSNSARTILFMNRYKQIEVEEEADTKKNRKKKTSQLVMINKATNKKQERRLISKEQFGIVR